MSLFPLKPTHAPVKAYFAALALFQKHGHTTEGNTRSAFADLLKRCCGLYGWHLVEEYQFRGTDKQPLRADGALIDDLTLQHGIWEAKDTADDLQKEVKSKVAKGYPLSNTLFQSPDHAVLYQDNRIVFNDAIDTGEKLVEVLSAFFDHKQAHEVDWDVAVTKFADKIPDLASGVTDILTKEAAKNKDFRERFAAFAELCRQSINPDLSDDSIRKMLVQHLLTARIFVSVFRNQEFLRRNVIAAEIEKVIDSITSHYFSRDQFLKPLDRFYTAIERAAEHQEGYTEKQHFLNAVYEKFFQRFDAKQADTHGIVYTPQPIVDFMVRSVEEILQQEFGKSLSDSGVHILDPFTGTGNFITRIMQQIKRSALPHKYANELHCNEVMLLPYYIASMNIEQAFMERAGEYKPFEGICLADTFELADDDQGSLFVAENTARVRRQRRSPIKVVIGNPPYNVGQKRDNDNNKNRSYKALNKSVSKTYAKASAASSISKLDNPYVKAIRWATDRIGEQGVIAYITEAGYLHQHAFDGMRYHLARDFDSIYVLNLAGDVTTHPQFSGSSHNVFGIRLGVSISFFIKNPKSQRASIIRYADQPAHWRREQRLHEVATYSSILKLQIEEIKPDEHHSWLMDGKASDFSGLLAMRIRGGEKHQREGSIFARSSIGSNTGRDAWAYSYSRERAADNAARMINVYNNEVDRWLIEKESGRRRSFDAFVTSDETQIKWSSTLKAAANRGRRLAFDKANVKRSLYRPFTAKYQYFTQYFTHRRSDQQRFFPSEAAQNEVLVVSTYARAPFAVFAARAITDINFFVEPVQAFPFFIYDEDGTNRQENISDWALAEFRSQYTDEITKRQIFTATYAVLHHPEYRTRYAANLKRELPRIPFPPDFHAFAAAGKRLMDLHINYEQQPEYKLEQIEDEKAEVTYRVTRMRLSRDKTELRYNDFLLLRGIPPAVFDYRLGNRSALVGHRPVPRDNRYTFRHNQRPQPRGRPEVHPPPYRTGDHGVFRNESDHRITSLT